MGTSERGQQKVETPVNIYETGLITLCEIIFKYPDVISLAQKFGSIRGILVSNYWLCVKNGLVRIEEIEVEEKQRIWDMTKGFNHRLEMCKCIYLIEKMK